MLWRGGTLGDIEVAMRMHPRDFATVIDFWEERAAEVARS